MYKMDFICFFFKDNILDVFIVFEIWLSFKVIDIEIIIFGYLVVGKDWNFCGGVVVMFIWDGIFFKMWMDSIDNNINFVNNSYCVVGSGVVFFVISDYLLIYGIFKFGVFKVFLCIVEYCIYKKYNKFVFIKDINELSWSIIDDRDVDLGVNLWSILFFKVVNLYVFIKKIRIKGILVLWMIFELS